MTVVSDVRFAVPLYSSREAAGYLGVPATTFASWVKGYRRDFAHRAPVEGAPLVTGLPPESPAAPTIPSAASRKGCSSPRCAAPGYPSSRYPTDARPGPHQARHRARPGLPAAVRRRCAAVWEVSTEDDVDEEVRTPPATSSCCATGSTCSGRSSSSTCGRSPTTTSTPDAWSCRATRSPTSSPTPRSTSASPTSPTAALLSRLSATCWAGETVADVAGDFGIPIDEVTEFAQRERLLAA